MDIPTPSDNIFSSSAPDNASEGWLRHNEFKDLDRKGKGIIGRLQLAYFRHTRNLELPAIDLLVRMMPIIVICLFLTLVLKYDLLIISGFLFCFLTYDMARQKTTEAFRYDNRTIFLIAITTTLISKALFLLKDIYIRHDTLQHSVLNPVELYKICFLSASYQSFGFIKRGLIPTVVSFFSANYVAQLYMVQIIGFVVFIMGLILLNKKANFTVLQKRIFIPILLLSPIGIYYHFIFTLGFYDMTLIGLLFISIASKNRRASVIADVVGLLVHEAYIFLSLPYHIFNLVSLIQKKKSYSGELINIALNILVLLIIVQWPRPGMLELKNNYFLHYSSLKNITFPKDLDAFLPLSREGTLSFDFREMLRYYHSDRSLSFFFPVNLSLINVGFLSYFTNKLTGRLRIIDTLCSIAAFAFPLSLCLIGADFGRWLIFSFTGWMVYYIFFRPILFSKAAISTTCLYGVLLAALIFLPFGINYNPLFYFLFNK